MTEATAAHAESRATQLQTRRAELAEQLAATEELAAEFSVLNSLTETVHGRTPHAARRTRRACCSHSRRVWPRR